MANKKMVYLSDRTCGWVEDTTAKPDFGEKPKWSEAVNCSIEQYRFLLRESLPELDIEEWTILLNVYAGCHFPAHSIPARIASDMMDNIGASKIEDIANKGYAALVVKMHDLSQPAQMAILYFVQIFWANKWNADWPQIVEAIKAKF